MLGDFGPLSLIPGTPWWDAGSPFGTSPSSGGSGGGTPAPPINFAISDTLIFSESKPNGFSINAGVLISGRRPERPGRS